MHFHSCCTYTSTAAMFFCLLSRQKGSESMKIGTKVKLKTGEEVTLIEFYKIFIEELFNDGTSLGIDELLYELAEGTQESREAIKKEK